MNVGLFVNQVEREREKQSAGLVCPNCMNASAECVCVYVSTTCVVGAATQTCSRGGVPQQGLLVLAQALVILVQLLDLLQTLLSGGLVVDPTLRLLVGRGDGRQLFRGGILLCHSLLRAREIYTGQEVWSNKLKIDQQTARQNTVNTVVA